MSRWTNRLAAGIAALLGATALTAQQPYGWPGEKLTTEARSAVGWKRLARNLSAATGLLCQWPRSNHLAPESGWGREAIVGEREERVERADPHLSIHESQSLIQIQSLTPDQS